MKNSIFFIIIIMTSFILCTKEYKLTQNWYNGHPKIKEIAILEENIINVIYYNRFGQSIFSYKCKLDEKEKINPIEIQYFGEINQFRYLIRPSWNYYYLAQSIDKNIEDPKIDVEIEEKNVGELNRDRVPLF